jgi:hypothetical protein
MVFKPLKKERAGMGIMLLLFRTGRFSARITHIENPVIYNIDLPCPYTFIYT